MTLVYVRLMHKGAAKTCFDTPPNRRDCFRRTLVSSAVFAHIFWDRPFQVIDRRTASPRVATRSATIHTLWRCVSSKAPVNQLSRKFKVRSLDLEKNKMVEKSDSNLDRILI